MFRDDPGYAVQLLNSILEDGDQSELLTVDKGKIWPPNDSAELLPTPQIAKRWVSYLDEIRGQVDAGIRESKF